MACFEFHIDPFVKQLYLVSNGSGYSRWYKTEKGAKKAAASHSQNKIYIVTINYRELKENEDDS
jgi:hypothetical protein